MKIIFIFDLIYSINSFRQLIFLLTFSQKSPFERYVSFISEVVQEIVCQVVNRVQPPKSVRISDVSLALKISPERIKRPIVIVADLY